MQATATANATGSRRLIAVKDAQYWDVVKENGYSRKAVLVGGEFHGTEVDCCPSAIHLRELFCKGDSHVEAIYRESCRGSGFFYFVFNHHVSTVRETELRMAQLCNNWRNKDGQSRNTEAD